jgi:hypothetical protein
MALSGADLLRRDVRSWKKLTPAACGPTKGGSRSEAYALRRQRLAAAVPVMRGTRPGGSSEAFSASQRKPLPEWSRKASATCK